MTTGAEWNREELLQARRDAVELVPNSGRGNKKGDARLKTHNRTLLIDYKFTDKNSYAINLAEFYKFFMQAYKEQADPAIVAVFRTHGKELAIVEWDLLKDLLWNEHDD